MLVPHNSRWHEILTMTYHSLMYPSQAVQERSPKRNMQTIKYSLHLHSHDCLAIDHWFTTALSVKCIPRAAKKRVRVAEEMIWTPEPTCTQSEIASWGVRKTSPATIFHPLSSKSSLGPAKQGRIRFSCPWVPVVEDSTSEVDTKLDGVLLHMPGKQGCHGWEIDQTICTAFSCLIKINDQ